MRCRACGAAPLVHDGVGSLVCTSCGTLADPAQTILADASGRSSTVLHSAPRTRNGWRLAHTKQDRERKNTIAMCTFISSVLSRLGNPGLSPRAEAIFTQAMTRGQYRWGRRAKLTAGASIAIALRESRKSDSLRDIALFLDESPVSLARAFQSVVSLLDLSLASTDPAVHLPTLQAHLRSVIYPETLPLPVPSPLPKHLISVLSPISLPTAVRTATSLSQILLHHSPPLALASLPTPATACALLILGLEAEARAPLPHLGDLARTLGARFALAPGVVSSRYRIIYDLIEEWIRHVPWLDQFVYKGKGRAAAARSKVPKRAVIAKGIKDVIQFHEEIWLSGMRGLEKIKLDLECDPGDFANDDEGDDENARAPTAAASSSNCADGRVVAPPPGKRRRAENGDAMQVAYRFLLDPLSSRYLDKRGSNGGTSLLTHILTCSPDELSRARDMPLTRLELLAASRGGSTEKDIADEELFAVGELEGLLRSEQEREALQPLLELNWAEELSAEEAVVSHPQRVASETNRGAKRVNMDVLGRLLGGGDGSDEEVASPEADVDLGGSDSDDVVHHPKYQPAAEDAEVISGWRPMSPELGDFAEIRNTTTERYEEEL